MRDTERKREGKRERNERNLYMIVKITITVIIIIILSICLSHIGPSKRGAHLGSGSAWLGWSRARLGRPTRASLLLRLFWLIFFGSQWPNQNETPNESLPVPEFCPLPLLPPHLLIMVLGSKTRKVACSIKIGITIIIIIIIIIILVIIIIITTTKAAPQSPPSSLHHDR